MAAKRNSFNVSLSPEHAAILQARAGELDIAPTTLAGRFLADVLDGKDAALLHGELTAIRESVSELGDAFAAVLKESVKTRQDLTNATIALLIRSGLKPKEARAWVDQHLHEHSGTRPRA